MRCLLNERKITSIKVAGNRQEYWDTILPGFGVRVTKKGQKTFFVMCREHGKQRRLSLGQYPIITLSEARDMARDKLKLIMQGLPLEQKPFKIITLEDVFRSFIEIYAKQQTKDWRRTELRLNKSLIKEFGTKDIRDVSREDIISLLDKIVRRDAPIQANRVYANISKFFRWCAERGYVESNPIQHIKAAIAYAQAGWRIHPLKKKSKLPLLNNWPSKATTDLDVIEDWFKKYPDANIGGIPPSNVFVLDCDGSDGKTSYRSLGINIPTAKAKTPRGFHHYFYGSVLKSKIGLKDGLDLISGDGSRYLVLAPSKCNGKIYSWNEREIIQSLGKEDINKIEALLSKDKKKATALGTIDNGSRNEDLFKIACSLRRRGVSDSLISQALLSCNQAICKNPLPEKEVLTIAQSSSRYDYMHEDTYADMADVKQEKVNWFWYPYLARGCMAILEGPPGQGKSYLTMYLAALISSGGKFPFSREKVKAGRVLILNAEDDPASTLRPRLEKCGAVFEKDNIRFQSKFVPMNDDGLELLETEVCAYKPDLVIIDPLLTYMIGDMHRYNDSTIFMAGIDEIAREHGCCIIGVRHLTKANNDDATKRGIGSVGFAARARSVIQVGKAPDNEQERALAHAKTNLGEYGSTLVFSLTGGGREDVPEFKWVREADYSADALNKPNDPGRPSGQSNLRAFLCAELIGGPVGINVIMSTVANAGLDCSKNTVLRALGEIAEPLGKGPATKWRLK